MDGTKDPLTNIWGFHVHMEVPMKDFPRSLVVQKACKEYLQSRRVPVDKEDVIDEGYGPHIAPMWELRVESILRQKGVSLPPDVVLRELGAAAAWMAVNRGDLPAYIHPTMHDESLPLLEQLRQEGETNQKEAIWFGHRVEQKQDFFFNPPLNDDGTIVDTRTSRVFSDEQRAQMLVQGEEEMKAHVFRDPSEVVINGFHVHVDYEPEDKEKALKLFDACTVFLILHGVRPTSTRLYAPKENGPHNLGGWEFKIEFHREPQTIEKLGIILGWLMCNRQGLTVFAHAVSWEPGDLDEELKAHRVYAFFLDKLTDLDLGFFQKLIDDRNRAKA